MKWTALWAMTLALATPQAASAAPEPAEAALTRFFAALQERAHFLGLCEKHRDKAELDELAAFLARPDDQSTPLGVKMIGETQKAFDSGRAEAASRNWSADQCERAIAGAIQDAGAAMAEYERLEEAEAAK